MDERYLTQNRIGSLPPLEDLLSRTGLPIEPNPSYVANGVERDVPECLEGDVKVRRVLADPEERVVYFPSPGDVSPASRFLNVNDSLFARLLTATDGLRYHSEFCNFLGLRPQATLDLCRSSEPVSGSGSQARYKVFVTEAPLISAYVMCGGNVDEVVDWPEAVLTEL